MTAVTPDLIERAIAREPRAVRELFGVLTPIIQARVARVLLRRGAARNRDVRQEVLDLTQQVYVALLEKDGRRLRSWDPARGLSLENYVGLIAEQQAVSVLRGHKTNPWREQPVEEDELDSGIDSSRTPERLAASKEALSTIFDHVHTKLSERGIELFHMLFIEGRSLEEVCSVMAMSASAVYAWRSRMGRLIEQIASELVSETPLPSVKRRGEPK